MAHNDQNNDEYKFPELDSHENEYKGETESDLKHSDIQHTQPEKNDTKRNAAIVIVLIVVFFILYKLFGSMFSGKTTTDKTPATPVIQPAPFVPAQPPKENTVLPVQPARISSNDASPDIKQKVSTIELNQQTVRADLTTMSQQVGNVNNNVNNLNMQIVKLNQTIEMLSKQVSQQADDMKKLMAHPKKRMIKSSRGMKSIRVQYSIQAVIPGRAWLIGSNGSTLTVSEGSKVPGYGFVKLIDSIQGRLITSSGQLIRFSQEDS